jgi:hypothetical protein
MLCEGWVGRGSGQCSAWPDRLWCCRADACWRLGVVSRRRREDQQVPCRPVVRVVMWIGVGDGQGVRRAWKDGVARQAENKDRHISLSSLPGVPCIGVAVCAKAGKGRALKERKGTLHSHSSDSDTKRKSSTRRSLVVGGRTPTKGRFLVACCVAAAALVCPREREQPPPRFLFGGTKERERECG